MTKHTKSKTITQNRTTILSMVYIALFVCILSVCSIIRIPFVIPFTMQTFAVFLTLLVLGGGRGTAAIVVYLLLGAIGAPVFSGMQGGIGVLLNTTGGYLIGFLFTGFIYWGLTALVPDKFWIKIPALILGHFIVCYAFGSAWFYYLYTRNTGSIGFLGVLQVAVFPFIPIDLVKLGLALAIRRVLTPALPDFLKDSGSKHHKDSHEDMPGK